MDKNELITLLERHRLLPIIYELTSEGIRELRNMIFYMVAYDNSPIKLYIDCDGGSIEPALMFANFLHTLEVPTIGFVCGCCQSAANVILQGCTTRLATPDSQFYMHFNFNTFGYKLREPHLAERMQTNIKHSETIEKQALRFLAKRTGNSLKNIRALAEHGEYHDGCFTAQEAKRLGFIDRIITEKFPLFPAK